MGKVFICYRTDDSADITDSIRRELVKAFGKERAANDVNFQFSYDYREQFREAMRSVLMHTLAVFTNLLLGRSPLHLAGLPHLKTCTSGDVKRGMACS
jgi:hypothetical protein